MGDLAKRIADGDRVLGKVVVPLAKNEALLSLNTTPDANNVGGSGVGALLRASLDDHTLLGFLALQGGGVASVLLLWWWWRWWGWGWSHRAISAS